MSGGTAPKKLREKWEEESNQKLFQEKEIKNHKPKESNVSVSCTSSGSPSGEIIPLNEKKRNAKFLDEPDKYEWAFKDEDVKETLKNIKEELKENNDTFLDCLIARKGLAINNELIMIYKKNIKGNNETFLKHAGEMK